MDSFYDTPRLPPSLLGTDQLLGLPEVPEISLLCPPNAPNHSQQTHFLPYNKWKLQNKENFQSTNSSILKKVRFEPPTKPPLLPIFRDNYGIDFETNKTKKQPDLNPNKPLDFNPKKLLDFNPNKKQHWELQLDSTKQFDFNNPNKQLDLSIINAPKANNNAVDESEEEESRPKCYKDFLELQKITINDSVTDIFHYKPSAQETCSNKKEEPVEKTANTNDDVSVKDLLKIITQQSQQITQQNTQIMLLQQQVSELMTIQRNQIENRQAEHHACCFNKININNRQKNNNEIVPVQNQLETHQYEDNVCQQTNKNYMMRLENDNVEKYQGFNTEKFAKMTTDNYRSNISIKTSFEVVEVFRRKQEMKSTPMKNALITRASDNPSNSSASSFESNKTFIDTSLTLKEPIKVDIPCPSPEPSIKIDMNEFDSEESSEEDDDGESCEIEATFYKNLMGQVNKILRNAKTRNFPEKGDLNNRTLHRVREATLKHFKKIGVDLPSIDENFHNNEENVQGNNSYSEDEVSFAVKQLLMKYLPAEYLTKVAVNEKETKNNKKQFAGPIKNRPDFSLATIQYMQKYNLMSNQNKIRSNEKQKYKETKSSPKVLDLTKLKQQPKLL